MTRCASASRRTGRTSSTPRGWHFRAWTAIPWPACVARTTGPPPTPAAPEGDVMETLIFDCDGVLVDSEAIAEATLVALLGEWLPDLDADAALGQALGMTTAHILRHLEGLSAHRLPDNATERVDETIEARLAEELRAMPGVAAAIDAIELPKAVVSNSRRRRVLASLATTGLAAHLDGAPIFTAEQVARPKPDPALYRLAAETLGTLPERCLVVEDSVSGVRAARGAGMTV